MVYYAAELKSSAQNRLIFEAMRLCTLISLLEVHILL